MAQGKLKTKVKVPVHGKPKHGDRNKRIGPKRGAKTIAPKKAKLVQAAKLKKGLEISIRTTIEQDVSVRASAVEPKSFHLVKPSSVPAVTSKQGSQTSKGKGKGKQSGKK